MIPLLSILSLLLAASCAALARSMWCANRRLRRLHRERREREEEALELLEALRTVSAQPLSGGLPGLFCRFCEEHLSGTGAVMCFFDQKREPDRLQIIAVSGLCSSWFPPLDDSRGEWHTVKLEGGVSYDFFWSRHAQIYAPEAMPGLLPEAYHEAVGQAVIAPVRTPRGDGYLAVFRAPDSPEFRAGDQSRLDFYLGFMDLGAALIRSEARAEQLEQAQNSAHEEGMLQISTGIIHNIGNAITVIQLALDRLASDEFSSCDQMIRFLDGEVLPTVRRHLQDGSIAAFLESEEGGNYMEAIPTVVRQIATSLERHNNDLRFVIDKFSAVTEVISLQQQFIGELGTENVVGANSLFEDVAKLCLNAFEQRGIALAKDFRTEAKVLLDPAMFRHMLLMLIKHAVDSVAASRKTRPEIRLATGIRATDGSQPMVRFEIRDNGVGDATPFQQDGAVAGSQPMDARNRDFFFCQRRAAKYHGTFSVTSDFGRGTTVAIELPQYTGDSRDRPPEATGKTPQP